MRKLYTLLALGALLLTTSVSCKADASPPDQVSIEQESLIKSVPAPELALEITAYETHQAIVIQSTQLPTVMPQHTASLFGRQLDYAYEEPTISCHRIESRATYSRRNK